MDVPELEKKIGIEVYATCSSGIGGVIKQHPEDFAVEEVLIDGSRASLNIPELGDSKGVLGSSSSKDRYLLCVLVKANWDTFSAVKAVADKLGISTTRIQIAGIKDARAVTAQYITIQGASAQETGKVRVKDIQVRPIGYFRHRLSSYYLLGNSFHIIVKSINHAASTVQGRTEKIKEELELFGGIPNFFGHQRFGTIRPVTHLVGREMAKGNFQEAAMIFLSASTPHEHPQSRRARERLQTTRDFQQALREFPKQLRYERLMLKHLAKRTGDFTGAFDRLPTKLRRLFPQAYQAYLFNKFLSGRIAAGLRLDKAEVGDQVLKVDRYGLPVATSLKSVTYNDVAEINAAIQSGRTRLTFPLVGFRQSLSQGVQGEIERRILEEEGSLSNESGGTNMPKTELRGELRPALAPMQQFSLKLYEDEQATPSTCKAEMSFMLRRGSYATVFLREIMKPSNLIEAGF